MSWDESRANKQTQTQTLISSDVHTDRSSFCCCCWWCSVQWLPKSHRKEKLQVLVRQMWKGYTANWLPMRWEEKKKVQEEEGGTGEQVSIWLATNWPDSDTAPGAQPVFTEATAGMKVKLKLKMNSKLKSLFRVSLHASKLDRLSRCSLRMIFVVYKCRLATRQKCFENSFPCDYFTPSVSLTAV